jgi:hypothetical protein
MSSNFSTSQISAENSSTTTPKASYAANGMPGGAGSGGN